MSDGEQIDAGCSFIELGVARYEVLAAELQGISFDTIGLTRLVVSNKLFASHLSELFFLEAQLSRDLIPGMAPKNLFRDLINESWGVLLALRS